MSDYEATVFFHWRYKDGSEYDGYTTFQVPTKSNFLDLPDNLVKDLLPRVIEDWLEYDCTVTFKSRITRDKQVGYDVEVYLPNDNWKYAGQFSH